jgi:uncharacterized protein (TIGR02996 family)
MDHNAFLGPLTEHPDDAATLLVYADWLEDHGEPGRAAFLRAQERSRRLTHSRRGFLTACREAIALGTRRAATATGISTSSASTRKPR